MANTVQLTFAGDARSLDRTFDQVGKGAKDMAKDVDQASSRLDSFGDSTEGLTKNARGGKDVLDGFSDSMDALGVSLPGPIGNIAGMAGGIADMADGLGTVLAPALAKARAGMALLNATIMANPIGAAVLAIAALTAGFVIAYKKSETFRNIVHGALDGVRAAFGWVLDSAEKVWNFLRVLPGKVSGAFDGLADLMTKPFRVWAEAVRAVWNSTIGGKGFSFGGWDPPGPGSIPAISFRIPTFANGGRTVAGPMVVGERGPELFVPDVPGHVITNNQLRGGAGGSSAAPVVVRFEGDGAVIDLIRRLARIEGGGDVQLAFGS